MSVGNDLLDLLYVQTVHILCTSILNIGRHVCCAASVRSCQLKSAALQLLFAVWLPPYAPHVLCAACFRPLMPAQIRRFAAPFRCMAAAICRYKVFDRLRTSPRGSKTLYRRMCGLADDKEWLAVFYCLAVFYKNFCYGSCEITFNFVHQFHSLDNTNYLTG